MKQTAWGFGHGELHRLGLTLHTPRPFQVKASPARLAELVRRFPARARFQIYVGGRLVYFPRRRRPR